MKDMFPYSIVVQSSVLESDCLGLNPGFPAY